MASAVVCRYCGERFVPKLNKPGFVDECPECLHEKTAAATPRRKTVSPAALDRVKQLDQLVRSFKRVWARKGLTKEQVDAKVRALIRLALGE
jgi:hypothetical protein